MKKAYGMILFAWIVLAALLAGCAGETAGSAPESGPGTEAGVSQSASPSSDSESESGAEEELKLVFECHDMDGNDVSDAVFANSKLTMINVWATYCGPCLNEMPALGKLAEQYEQTDFQIIGVICDVVDGRDADALHEAAVLIADTGANYTHLPLNESLYDAFVEDVSVVPTTFFVDENGVVLETVLGARKKSEWEETIHALLEGR